MRELPSAGGRQDGDLDQSPAHNTGVGRFGLITEFGFTFPLVNLLATNILEPAVQVLDTLDDILHLVLVLGFDLAGLSNGNVNSELHSTGGVAQPGRGGVRLGREADSVLTSVGSREVEATGVAVTLGYNAVVVVEGLLDGDEHLHVVVDVVGSGLGIDDLALIATGHQRILRQVLEEALCLPALHVEVEGISGENEREKGEQSKG